MALTDPSLPVVQIDQPAAGAVLTGDVAELAGSASTAKGRITKLEYSFADAGDWTVLDAGSEGSFDAVVALPPVDHRPLAFNVRATDERGAQGVGTVVASVDDVAPTATFSAADQNLRASRTLRITFSEPVLPSPGTPSIRVTPDAGVGTWSGDKASYVVSDLSPNTVYTASVPAGGVTDAVGHPGLAAASTFRTQGAQPLSGTTVAPPGGLTAFVDFDAVSDSSGVVTVVARALDGSGNDSLVWGQFDPASGVFAPAQTPLPGSAQQKRLAAVAFAGPTPSAPRVSGFWVNQVLSSTDTHSAYWQLEGGAVQSRLTDTFAVLPTPSGCAEAATADPPGVALAIDGGNGVVYSRPPNAAEPWGVTPDRVAARSPQDWVWFAQSGNQIDQGARLCDCADGGTHACRFLALPGASAVVDAATQAHLSVAITQAHSLYVYDNVDGSARTEVCQQCAAADGGALGCVAEAQSTSKVGQYLQVASTHTGEKVLGARLTLDATPKTELLERDLSTCTGAWTVIGTLDSSSAEFRPVMFGNQPGLLYLTSDKKLGVYVP